MNPPESVHLQDFEIRNNTIPYGQKLYGTLQSNSPKFMQVHLQHVMCTLSCRAVNVKKEHVFLEKSPDKGTIYLSDALLHLINECI